MLAFKTIRPYHIEVIGDYLNFVLQNSDFTILINNNEYQFIPMKAKSIKMNRENRQIVNPNDIFAFHRDHDIIYITLTRLIQMTDFLIELHRIAKPYYSENNPAEIYDIDMIIDELERLNIKRLIDKALDQGDQDNFYRLLKLL